MLRSKTSRRKVFLAVTLAVIGLAGESAFGEPAAEQSHPMVSPRRHAPFGYYPTLWSRWPTAPAEPPVATQPPPTEEIAPMPRATALSRAAGWYRSQPLRVPTVRMPPPAPWQGSSLYVQKVTDGSANEPAVFLEVPVAVPRGMPATRPPVRQRVVTPVYYEAAEDDFDDTTTGYLPP